MENGITDLPTALKVLQMAGITNSPDYWKQQVKDGEVRYLSQLLINIANRSRDPLERIVWTEARGEDLKGQTLVANVVLNRSRSKQFPDGIYNVIMQNGVNSQGILTYQFISVSDGSYERATPNDFTKQSVSEALSGKDYSNGALFFHAVHSVLGSWHERNLMQLFIHGGHAFFV